MKLPRWLVIAMLTSSVLSVLAAAGWWWVTWPDRTAREYVALIVAGKEADAQQMIRYSPEPEALWGWFHVQGTLLDWNPSDQQSKSRTLFDVCSAREVFLIDDLEITVEWGSIATATAHFQYDGPVSIPQPAPQNIWKEYLHNPPKWVEAVVDDYRVR